MRFIAIALAALAALSAAKASDYVPPMGSWRTHTPQEEGFDPARLQARGLTLRLEGRGLTLVHAVELAGLLRTGDADTPGRG